MNYTIKCNSKEKKEFIQICGKIELRNQNFAKEICMNYKHFTIEELLSTRILCKREKLSGNRKTSRQKCEFGIEGITAELYFFQGYTEILSEYAQKKSNLRNSYRHRGMFWKQEVLDYIDEKYRKHGLPNR